MHREPMITLFQLKNDLMKQEDYWIMVKTYCIKVLPMETIQKIAGQLAIDPQQLVYQDIRRLDENSIEIIRGVIEKKQCYKNSILAALSLNASAIVYGAVYDKRFGLAIEHCWLEMSEDMVCDPTYQVTISDFSPNQFDYYQLIKIPLCDYFDTAYGIAGHETIVLDFWHFRKHKTTQHLFNHRISSMT